MKHRAVVLVGMFVSGCVPVEGVPGGSKTDSGFTLVLDTAVWDGTNPCSPVISSEVTLVLASTVLSEPGEYLVCPRVPVQASADDLVVYLSEYSYAAVTGSRALVFAKQGAQVTMGGVEGTIVSDRGAVVNIAASEVQTLQCDALTWSQPLVEETCPAR